jgi:hypothetical protein
MPFLYLIPLMGSHVSKWGKAKFVAPSTYYLLNPKFFRFELGSPDFNLSMGHF